jgi:hypothetical protein
MHTMLRFLLVLPLGFLTIGIAAAGPNDGGVLLLHAAPFEGRIGRPICGLVGLSDCADARVNIPATDFMAWSVFAAFAEGSDPRLLSVTFGVEHDPNIYLANWESCGPIETPDSDWPNPGSGTKVSWGISQTAEITEVYAFLGYAYYGSGAFCLFPHPTQGGWFGDDSTPPVLDPIADYGCLGFGDNPGYLPCPVANEVGACCLPDGSCQVITESACADEAGNWQGVGSDCDSDPCTVPTLNDSWGSLKRQFR